MKSSNSSKSHPIMLSGVHYGQIVPHLSGADPGFPVGGSANPQGGVPTYSGGVPLDLSLLITTDIDPDVI